MKSLGEIINNVRNGEKPEYDDLRYALVAMDCLTSMDSADLRRMAAKGTKFYTPMKMYEMSFDRWKSALKQDPKVYVSPNQDPDIPENVERRAKAFKLVDKFMKKQS